MPASEPASAEPTTPVYVRLPSEQAERLDAAAHALGASKRELVTQLVARYLAPLAEERRVVIERDDPALVVGRHSFRAVEPPEVLTLAQAADLLQVEEGSVAEMASRGELPGRRVGDAWRFSRTHLLAWLAG
jgi:excisionase family DNA binding protein